MMLKTLHRDERKEMTSTLAHSEYPYTYARTTAMRGMLLKKADYHKILKMDFNEIARFLEETTYKKSIDTLSASMKGADLLEAALNNNLAESFAKLRAISPEELRLLIDEYLRRNDIEDIKTILRGKLTKAGDKIIAASLQAAGTMGKDALTGLLKKESIEQILKGIDFIDFARIKPALERLRETNSLEEIENELDRSYYQGLLELAASLPSEGDLFRDFLLQEIEIMNIVTIIKLKHAGIDKSAISNFLIFTGVSGNKNLFEKLMNSDIGSMTRYLEARDYSEAIVQGLKSYEKNGSLIELEASLHTHLLRKSVLLLHQHPLSVDVILGYMFAKETEVRNLKIIVRGKQLGVGEEFIEKQLVI
ncbi:ATP synthase A1 subunit C [Candidatus Woesearchaeota archaeon]|nr:ATP synthase A1 subunit C [Candidatus Woesearchaeota archaeon]